MTQLTIASKSSPIAYPVAALTRILRTMKIDATQLSEKATSQNLADMVEFTATVAWAGLVSGAVKSGKPKPFGDPDELLEAIESLEQLAPSLTAFSEAWAKFTGADEAKEQPADPAETEATSPGELLPPTV
jgi:hypothetical protein